MEACSEEGLLVTDSFLLVPLVEEEQLVEEEDDDEWWAEVWSTWKCISCSTTIFFPM